MLQSVKIHQFRTCHQVTLRNPSQFVVLLGRNGAGKTNILSAVSWAASMALPQEPAYGENAHVELTFRIGRAVYVYDVQRSKRVLEDNKTPQTYFKEILSRRQGRAAPIVIFERDGAEVRIQNMPGTGTINTELPALNLLASVGSRNSIMPDIDEVVGFLSGVKYYPLLSLVYPTARSSNGVFLGSAYEEWKKRPARSVLTDEDMNLSLIQAALEQSEKFDEIKALLDHRGLGVLDRVSVVDISPEQSGPTKSRIVAIFFSPPGTPDDHPGYTFAQLSMGTQRIIQLISQIVLDRITVALIEQPEDGIHPALLRKLIGILKAYSIAFDFILTSHSPDVFNAVAPSQVRMVSMDGVRTRAIALTRSQIDLARQYMEDSGTLAEFLESM
jgi:hypothetical protein